MCFAFFCEILQELMWMEALFLAVFNVNAGISELVDFMV